jgi:hypothetical protein
MIGMDGAAVTYLALGIRETSEPGIQVRRLLRQPTEGMRRASIAAQPVGENAAPVRRRSRAVSTANQFRTVGPGPLLQPQTALAAEDFTEATAAVFSPADTAAIVEAFAR